MVATNPRTDRAQALAVYVEPFAEGRRVVVFADRALALGGRLAALGARVVVEVAPGDDLAPLRGRAFDVALVIDPASFGPAGEVLGRVRRLLADDGIALVTAGESLDYYGLFDLTAAEFEEVRMVGQLSFRGVALAELGSEENPAVSVDTQLADPDRAPDEFVAVASRRRVELDPYAIVELPQGGDESVVPARDEAPEVYAALAQERLRAEALGAELVELRRLASVSRQLEDALGVQVSRVADLEAALEEEREEAEEGRAAIGHLEEAELRAAHAERASEALEKELASVAQAHVLELARFEEALRERAQAIRALEAEVLRRDRMVRELVDAIEERGPASWSGGVPPAEGRPPSADPTALTDELARENSILRWRLDALAMELARRDADAQAGEWAIQELEHELAREAESPAATPVEGGAPAAPPNHQAAELDALRLALAEEHRARVRAESGEELAVAREEISRQAVLIEQLSRELETTRLPQGEVR